MKYDHYESKIDKGLILLWILIIGLLVSNVAIYMLARSTEKQIQRISTIFDDKFGIEVK
jgi:hypothetical protein